MFSDLPISDADISRWQQEQEAEARRLKKDFWTAGSAKTTPFTEVSKGFQDADKAVHASTPPRDNQSSTFFFWC